jgi:hypothetical protein
MLWAGGRSRGRSVTGLDANVTGLTRHWRDLQETSFFINAVREG